MDTKRFFRAAVLDTASVRKGSDTGLHECHLVPSSEYDERIYEKAAENKKDAVSSGRVEIELANAEEFAVPVKNSREYMTEHLKKLRSFPIRKKEQLRER